MPASGVEPGSPPRSSTPDPSLESESSPSPEPGPLPSLGALVEAGQALLARGGPLPQDVTVAVPDGREVELPASLLVELARDHTAGAQRLARVEGRLRALVHASSDVIVVIDAAGQITWVSDAAQEVTGYQTGEVTGAAALDLVHPDDLPAARDLISALARRPGSQSEVRFRLARRDGCWRWMEGTARNLLDDDSVRGLVINIRDVTERKALQDQLRFQAFHDALTGLPSRPLIMDRAAQMLARSRRSRTSCAALLVGLDQFKRVNDDYGHPVGDRLLGLVAERLRLSLRGSDTLGRIGGDEFVVLAEGSSLDAGPEIVADRLLRVFDTPFELDGISIVLSASIGVAVGWRDGVDGLFRDADIALYRAKKSGRGRSCLFTPVMKEALDRRAALLGYLPHALEREEFFLEYQPLFDLPSGSVEGAEALLRLRHPEAGVVAPGEFVPLLEESSLIEPVGRWVLIESCVTAARFHAEGHRLSMAVNVSPRQLDKENLLHDDVVFALTVSGLEPRYLVLEITESTLMRDAEATARNLRRLKDLGVRIAIDDFGTGYSSLSYLAAFPVDYLKVDRSFIANLGQSTEADALLRSVLNLGRALSLTTVAEGIEDDNQLRVLRRHGCDQGQGFRLARPASAECLRRYLRVPRGALGA